MIKKKTRVAHVAFGYKYTCMILFLNYWTIDNFETLVDVLELFVCEV